jgi:FkbM family methyltransferase
MTLHRRFRLAAATARAIGARGLARIAIARLSATKSATVDESAIVFEALRPRTANGCMIDVGAHFGGSLLPFLASGWRVLAFEPDPRNRAVLNARFPPSQRLQVDERAVSDKSGGQATLFRSHESSGISSLAPFSPAHEPAAVVRTVSLADAIEEYGIAHIDFLKIDSEGFDLMVLRGLPWTRCRPRVIQCEFEDAKTLRLDYSYRDLASSLAEQGYRVIVSEWYPIQSYGGRHRWRSFGIFPRELSHPKAWGNLIAARDRDDFAAILEAFSTRASAVAGNST